jgi:hypothetical protein
VSQPAHWLIWRLPTEISFSWQKSKCDAIHTLHYQPPANARLLSNHKIDHQPPVHNPARLTIDLLGVIDSEQSNEQKESG